LFHELEESNSAIQRLLEWRQQLILFKCAEIKKAAVFNTRIGLFTFNSPAKVRIIFISAKFFFMFNGILSILPFEISYICGKLFDMEAVVVKARDKAELQFFLDLAERVGAKARAIDSEYFDNLVLIAYITEEDIAAVESSDE